AQPEIQILDIFGDPVPGATDAVTLEAFTDAGCTTPASGTLSAGTNPLTAAGGVAAFNGVSYTKAETIYLRASSGTLTSACSGPFAIGAGAATTFAFSTQPPATASSNVNFSTLPVVTFYDAHGNVATGAADAVTLSAYTNA